LTPRGFSFILASTGREILERVLHQSGRKHPI